MIWPFKRKSTTSAKILANSIIVLDDGRVCIDVRGQTCPGYLLAINKAVESLSSGTQVELCITYPPCSEDVKSWCKEKGHLFLQASQEQEKGIPYWIISIQK